MFRQQIALLFILKPLNRTLKTYFLLCFEIKTNKTIEYNYSVFFYLNNKRNRVIIKNISNNHKFIFLCLTCWTEIQRNWWLKMKTFLSTTNSIFKPDQLDRNSMELVVDKWKHFSQPQILYLSLTSWTEIQRNWWLLVIFDFTMCFFKTRNIIA